MLEETFNLLSILSIMVLPQLGLGLGLGLVIYIIMKRDIEELTELSPPPLLAIEMSQLSHPKHEVTTIVREIHTPDATGQPKTDQATHTFAPEPAPAPAVMSLCVAEPAHVPAVMSLCVVEPAPAPAVVESVPVPETASAEAKVKEPSDDVKYWLSLSFGDGAGETEPQPHPIKDVFEELRDKGQLALF